MSLKLYSHPLAAFCWKVLIALHEREVPFEAVLVDHMNPDSTRAITDRWPIGKMPMLHDSDGDRAIPETSIIIEYLDRIGDAAPMIPGNPDAALDVRLWDRFFDLYVGVPMQRIVGERLRPEGAGDPHGVAEARAMLKTAYAMLETQLAGKVWATGDSFTMTDCAASPALFYALIVAPPGPGHDALLAYFERLAARPAFARVLGEAKPWFQYFPYADDMPARFR